MPSTNDRATRDHLRRVREYAAANNLADAHKAQRDDDLDDPVVNVTRYSHKAQRDDDLDDGRPVTFPTSSFEGDLDNHPDAPWNN